MTIRGCIMFSVMRSSVLLLLLVALMPEGVSSCNDTPKISIGEVMQSPEVIPPCTSLYVSCNSPNGRCVNQGTLGYECICNKDWSGINCQTEDPASAFFSVVTPSLRSVNLEDTIVFPCILNTKTPTDDYKLIWRGHYNYNGHLTKYSIIEYQPGTLDTLNKKVPDWFSMRRSNTSLVYKSFDNNNVVKMCCEVTMLGSVRTKESCVTPILIDFPKELFKCINYRTDAEIVNGSNTEVFDYDIPIIPIQCSYEAVFPKADMNFMIFDGTEYVSRFKLDAELAVREDFEGFSRFTMKMRVNAKMTKSTSFRFKVNSSRDAVNFIFEFNVLLSDKVKQILIDKRNQDTTIVGFGGADEQALGYIGATMGGIGVCVFAAIVVIVAVQKNKRRAKVDIDEDILEEDDGMASVDI